jgi:hypothetical protein
MQGRPLGGGNRWTEVRGVVAGAAERVPIMSFTYRIKGDAWLMLWPV